jgi:hypothetical protein
MEWSEHWLAVDFLWLVHFMLPRVYLGILRNFVLDADCLMINIIPELRACGDASGKVLECMPASSRFFAGTMRVPVPPTASFLSGFHTDFAIC